MASLFKSLSTVGGNTLVSRIFGFIRDLVLAHEFGANAATDAFFVAFKIPNFLRRLFAEGAFSTAFVPVLTEYKSTRSFSELKEFVDHVAGALGLVVLLVSLLGVLFAPLVVSLFAVGWVIGEESEKLGMAADMLRLTFPYLFFISLTAFAGGILNTFGRFAIPAFTPVLLNLSLIGCALWLAPMLVDETYETGIIALGWAVLIAGITQLVFQLPFLQQINMLPRFKPASGDPGVKRILRLMIPALFAVSITQINLLLDTVLASFLVTGSISWLYYSDRLMEFPLGVLGVALGTVILPSLSRRHAEQSAEAFSHTLDWGLRAALLFGAPAATGLAILAGPLIATLFLSDVFDANDVAMARLSLMAYSLGLIAFILIKVLAPGYYSRQDTKSPVRIGVIAMAANMLFNLLLIFPLQHAGLALATSLSAYINAYLLYRGLRQKQVYHPDASWPRLILKIALACVAMASVIWLLAPDLSAWIMMGGLERIQQLLLWVLVGAVSYFAVLFVLGFRPGHLRSKS